MKKRIVLPTLLVLFATVAFAQGGGKASPPATATCDLGGGKTIKTNYSSPRMRGPLTSPPTGRRMKGLQIRSRLM